MRFRTILTSGHFVLNVSRRRRLVGTPALQPFSRVNRPATQSGPVSGRTSAVRADSLSVDVQKSQEPMTLRFLIDNNTKIDGKLKVGVTATVDYRTEDVNNIAVHVVVHPVAAY
jgi:hypothetical protein